MSRKKIGERFELEVKLDFSLTCGAHMREISLSLKRGQPILSLLPHSPRAPLSLQPATPQRSPHSNSPTSLSLALPFPRGSRHYKRSRGAYVVPMRQHAREILTRPIRFCFPEGFEPVLIVIVF